MDFATIEWLLLVVFLILLYWKRSKSEGESGRVEQECPDYLFDEGVSEDEFDAYVDYARRKIKRIVRLEQEGAVAYMGGYDLKSDQVQTLAYLCLAGNAVGDVLKDAGIKIGTKMATSALKRLPGAVLTKINQRVGFRLLTKFGQKGVINLVKLIPVAGGAVGAVFDATSTKLIADNAVRMFLDGEIDTVSEEGGPLSTEGVS